MINDAKTIKSELQNNPILSLINNIDDNLKKPIGFIIPKNISNNSLICLSNIGKEDLGYTYIGNSIDFKTDSLSKQISYSGHKINLKNDSTDLFSTIIDSNYIISNSKLIIENYIRNYQNNAKGIDSSVFKELKVTLDLESPVNLLINPSQGLFFKPLFNSTPLFPKVGYEWNAYDLNFNDYPLGLDGVVKIQDSLADPISLFKNLEFKNTELEQIVPQTYTSFLSIPFKNIEVFKNNYKKYIRNKNIPLNSIDLNHLNSIDEIGCILFNEEKALVFHSNNQIISEAIFVESLESKKTYRNIDFGKTKLPKELNALSKILAIEIDVKWVTRLGEFFVFTETESAIKNLIGNYKDLNTLSNDIDFLSFKKTLAKENSMAWFGNTKNIINYWKKTLSQNKIWDSLNHKSLKHIAFQGISDQNYMHLHFRINKSDMKYKKNTVLNQYVFSLDAPAANSPQWIRNHRTKRKDIVIQDENNVLYLFSDKGILFWKKKLNSKIIGPIQQVDLFKNKRLQMAFRTKKKLLIIDRNGEIVKPFSIEIADSEPIQPLSIFDYDNNRDYRFVLSQGKSIQMLNSKGKKVNGFTFKEAKSSIINPPEHIKIGNKDFIIIQESNGKLNILNRKGKARITLKENIDFSENKISLYLKTFITSNKKGELIQIDTKGHSVSSDLKLSKNHKITSTPNSLVTISENVLNIKGIPIILPYGDYTNPLMFNIKNTIYISITDKQDEKVYLFYSNGLPVNGFPIYGKNTIDLSNADNDEGLELIVQTEKNVFTIYEIN